MLSPDPVTQAPENGQNYNRYSYVFNNPLKYKDPSGFTTEYTGDAVTLVIIGGCHRCGQADTWRDQEGFAGENQETLRWILPGDGPPRPQSGDTTDGTGAVVIVGGISLEFEEDLADYAAILEDFLGDGAYDSIDTGGGGASIDVVAGELPGDVSMRYDPVNKKLIIDVERLAGREGNIPYSYELIGSIFGHEIYHIADHTTGRVNIHDPVAMQQAELAALRWQRDTASTFGLDPEEYQAIFDSYQREKGVLEEMLRARGAR